MTQVESWPVKTAPVGQVAVGSALWRLEGQLMVTTIVKVTMGLRPDGPMHVIEPAAICVVDEHDDGHPMRSLRAARETVPQLQRVDVLLTGYAYPTRGAAEVDVSLAILGRGQTLLSKVVRVRGDRGRDGAVQPFERMRLGYERTYGGIGYLDNPLGTGFGATDAPPNIVYAAGDERRPAALGPIPALFPSRKRLLGDVAKRSLLERIAEVPLDFDWSYFQSAPEDQRINLLRGDEWIEIEGAVRDVPVLRSQLPGAIGVAKVYGAERANVPPIIPLMADMLHIDAEAMSASLTFRGSFPVADEASLATLTIAGGVELPDEPMLWPETEADLFDITSFMEAPTEQGRALRAVDVTTTRVMSAEERREERAADFAPFESTVTVEHPLAGTLSQNDDQIPSLEAPFELAPAGSRSPARPSAGIPGAPWAEASSAPEPLPIDANLKGTVTRTHIDDVTKKREADAKAKREADAKAKREAEAQGKREAEAQGKREAEAQSKREALAQAEARRDAEAERFRKEQAEAEAERAKRAAEKERKKQEAAKQLREDIYGGFKRKR